MNSTQIKCFLEVAKCHSFIRAADNLYTSQPVVSYQIKSLETELHVQLCARDSRNVELTPAGEYLYKQLEPIMHQIDDVLAETARIHNADRRSIALLVRRLADYSCLTRSIKLFSDKYPASRVDIMTNDDRSTKSLLTSGEIQLAFCYQYEVEDCTNAQFLQMDSAYYYVIVNTEHRLARATHLSFDDLYGEKIILANTALQSNNPLMSPRRLRQLGIDVPSPHPNFDSMLLSVQSGVGFTILPCSENKQFSSLVKIPLSGVSYIPLGLAWYPPKADACTLDFVKAAKAEDKNARLRNGFE